MSNFRIDLRYATALFEFAQERNRVEETFHDMQLIAQTTSQSRELRLLLKSPVVFTDKKLKIIHEILKDKIGIETKTFIDILVKKRREENIHGIAEAFIKIYRKSKNIKVASVTSALPLDESTRKQLIDLLQEQTGSTILLDEVVDATIIGGLIVTIEGIKFDDSVRKKVQSLRQEFNVNTYIKGF